MKLNLLMASNDILAGYTNIDPYPQLPQQGQTFSCEKECGNIENLDQFCENAQATEIIAMDCIDYINLKDKDNVIKNWCKKLAHGGKLTIGGVDFDEVARTWKAGSLPFNQYLDILYGHPEFPFGSRRGVFTLEAMSHLLRLHGLQIERQQLNQFRYLITGIRP